MLYELHVTTAPDADVTGWSALCRALGIKPLVIELAGGDHQRQVMMAAQHAGDDASARAWRCDIIDAFRVAGFPVVRVKLEVPLDKAAGYADAALYHEAHIKLLLDADGARALPGVAIHAGMHASANALQRGDGGLSKWYLTSRVYGCDIRAAADQFGEAFLRVHECMPGVRMEMETVLVDTNPLLDAGWAAP